MAEVRTRQALLDRFPDNTTGLITPENFRDWIVTSLGVYGGLYAIDEYNPDDDGTTIVPLKTAAPCSGVTVSAGAGAYLEIETSGLYWIIAKVAGVNTGVTPTTFKLRVQRESGAVVPGMEVDGSLVLAHVINGGLCWAGCAWLSEASKLQLALEIAGGSSSVHLATTRPWDGENGLWIWRVV